MKPELIFEKGLQFHHYANTAYPLTPTSLLDYKLRNQEDIKAFLIKDFQSFDELSLYVHIPFCKTRCKFCEYVVIEESDEEAQDQYVQLLLQEMKMYSSLLRGKKIIGYDLGGGTPSHLSQKNLTLITESITSLFNFSEEAIFSVETTPAIASKEIEKIQALYDLGYKRISMGVQSVSEKLLNELGREGSTSVYEKAVEHIRKVGYDKFNIDLMYGFLHQSDADFEYTLRYAIGLKPDFITLYRNRYKGTKIESESGGVSLYKIIKQYKLAYKILNEAGYVGNPGKNTFSKISSDYGTSDYLTNRVIGGIPYVGMGLGAQSLGYNYLAYNSGAANKQMKLYKEKINADEFPIQDIYDLPTSESISKMVSVAFYFGFVDLTAFKLRFNRDFLEIFEKEITFLIEGELMEIKDDRVYLTDRGADYINGIIPLFYSERSKKELIHLCEQKHTQTADEKIFLESYSMNDYQKLSVTSDCVIFKASSEGTEVLLIKRGEHPFMNYYALPGGFVRSDETVQQAAYRELKEETGIECGNLGLIEVFSKPNRDPRGRIISNVFRGYLEKNQKLIFGSDAIDAIWVNIHDLDQYKIAFDHEEMIEVALRGGM